MPIFGSLEYGVFLGSSLRILRSPVQHGDQVCSGTRMCISYTFVRAPVDSLPLMSFAIPVIGDASNIRTRDLHVVRYSGRRLTLDRFARLITHLRTKRLYIENFLLSPRVNKQS